MDADVRTHRVRELRASVSYVPEEFDVLTVVLLLRGPHPDQVGADARSGELQAQHLAHLASMFEREALAVAGPVARDDADELRGLCLYRAGAEEAMELAAADPAVRAGRLSVEARRWRFPAGYISFPKQGVPWWTARTPRP